MCGTIYAVGHFINTPTPIKQCSHVEMAGQDTGKVGKK